MDSGTSLSGVSASPRYERTLVILKPDAVRSGGYVPILARLFAADLRLTGCFLRKLTLLDCQQHYKHEVGKDHWQGLAAFMMSGPSLICVFEGPNAIETARQILKDTRTAFNAKNPQNLMHASDAVDTAAAEIKFWFTDGPGYFTSV